MEIQNQVSRILRGNLARLRDVLDEAVSQGAAASVPTASRSPRARPVQRASCPGVGRPEGGRPRLAACGSARSRRWGPGAGAPASGGAGSGRAGHGRRGSGSDTGAGGDRRAAPGLEHADGVRASARRRSVRRPATAVSGGFGAWLAGRGRVRGECAAAAGPRRLGRVGRYWPTRAPAPGVGTVPAAGAPRRCVPQLGLARAGPGRPGGRRRLRASVWLSPLAAGDVRRRDRTDGGERARGELGSGG